MSVVTVVPFMALDLLVATLASLDPDYPERVVVPVDNCEPHNAGISVAWNVGARQVLDGDAMWLMLLSTAVRFEPGGERVFLDHLASSQVWMVSGLNLNWHCCAIHRDALERVGLFDPLFAPAYFEDTDWTRRATLSGSDPRWEREYVAVPHTYLGDHHTLQRGLVSPGVFDMEGQHAKYREKWGGPLGAETYTTPWGRMLGLDWIWPDELAAREAI